MASSGFPTPFAINNVKGIPGPAGPPGSTGAAGPGQGIDCTTKGCVGDGTTDCTAGFALAATAASSDPSRTVYVPAGAYKLASTQTISAPLKFAPGAMLKPAAGQTVTISGQIQADDYQQIFDTSAGGSISIQRGTNAKLSACWFGADPNSDGVVGSNTKAINMAIASSFTGENTGDGPINVFAHVPSGTYELEKPVVINANNQSVRGDGKNSSFLQARTAYVGPAIVCSDNDTITQHLNDYDTTLASATIGDGPLFQLNSYGNAWELDGIAQFSLDFICKISSSQTGLTFLLSSTGNGPDNTTLDVCFHIELLNSTAGPPYLDNNLGLLFKLTTSSGAVSAFTASPVLPTDGTWHHLRFDYDGADMRIFVDGVAQTLNGGGTAKAQTGTLKQALTEGVVLGSGTNVGFGGTSAVNPPPTGCRLAQLHMTHVSQGSSNFTPPTGKYPETGNTQCMINFDTVDPVGGLIFARVYATSYGLKDAWLANSYSSGTQIGFPQVEGFQIYSPNGPAVEAMSTPNGTFKRLRGRAKSGVLLHGNNYFSIVEECWFTSSGGWGHGVKLGGASNFCGLKDISLAGFVVDVFSISSFSASGGNYWTSAQYAWVYLEQVYQANLTGSCFISDEASSYHATLGVVLKGCGNILLSGFLFGLQFATDQYQVYIDNSLRPTTQDKVSRVVLDSCIFATALSSLAAIKVANTLAIDRIELRSCTQGVTTGSIGVDIQDYFSTTNSLARLIVTDREITDVAITLTDANTTLTQDQWQYGKIVFSGTLTADRNIVVPTIAGYRREIQNLTAHALLVKTASGTGTYVPPGLSAGVSCDGTNVVLDWLEGVPVQLINSGTSSTASAWAQVVGVNVGTAYNLTGPTGTTEGQTFVVKDNSGAAGTNNITLTAPSGQTYDGAATATIATNYGRVSLMYDGVSNWMS